jgi:hypothetical protein
MPFDILSPMNDLSFSVLMISDEVKNEPFLGGHFSPDSNLFDQGFLPFETFHVQLR